MKSCILTVGTEILFGQIVNTNAQFLSVELNNLGHDVMYHKVVGDNEERLMLNLKQAFDECDLIITTGGLGPTQDDMTKETIAKYFGEKLVLHDDTMKMLETSFEKRGITMTENNVKQAYIPKGSKILLNPMGTAPGFLYEKNGKIIISLPGPPHEMKPMFLEEAKPILEEKSDMAIYYEFVKTIGIGESTLETKLMPIINGQTDPTIATYASTGECYIRIASKRKTRKEAKIAVEDTIVKINNIIGKYIYSHKGEKLSEVVFKEILSRKLTISAAESCTGGLFTASIVDMPDASKVLDRGIVTYSNEAKITELGVKKETIEKFGAVSSETAIEMAEGIRKVSGSDLGISVTGIAGPSGDNKDKPIGLVYIGISSELKTEVYKYNFPNRGRNYIRNRSVLMMYREVLRFLEVQ